MTPPDTKSAEAQAANVTGHCFHISQHQEWLVACPGCIAAAIRAAKIEAWQEAARAVCETCADPDSRGEGWTEARRSINRAGPETEKQYYHVSVDDEAFRDCYAGAIHALIAAAAPPRVAEPSAKPEVSLTPEDVPVLCCEEHGFCGHREE